MKVVVALLLLLLLLPLCHCGIMRDEKSRGRAMRVLAEYAEGVYSRGRDGGRDVTGPRARGQGFVVGTG